MKSLYNLWYKHGTPPWVTGPREELVALVDSGALTPCRAVDLGCGTGDNVAFLQQRGFDATGIDFAPAAIARAEAKARNLGLAARLVVDDLTRLRLGYGTFDLIVDYGTFDDLSPKGRAKYAETVRKLSHARTRFLLWCFEWRPRWWERAIAAPFGSPGLAIRPGEVEAWFGADFEVERIGGAAREKGWPRGWGVYLMTRRNGARLEGAT